MEVNPQGVIVLDDVEIAALQYEKPNKSGPWTDNCLEVAQIVDPQTRALAGFALRNSRDPEGPMVTIDVGEFQAFAQSAADGQYGPVA